MQSFQEILPTKGATNYVVFRINNYLEIIVENDIMSEKIPQHPVMAQLDGSNTPNLDYLMELSGGDKSFVFEIIEMFIKDAPLTVQQAQSYYKEKNYDLLKVTVHKLKSSVQVFGVNSLALLIREIETIAKEQSELAMLPNMIEKLDQEIEKMVKTLSGTMANQKV